jgi:CheY-like chemotaxis protein
MARDCEKAFNLGESEVDTTRGIHVCEVASRPDAASDQYRNAGGTTGKTPLLADDSVTIQKVVGISFANEDIAIVTVDNGDDAIAKARELRPDAILADVVMPGKSGYEVCQAIKADPSLQHVPVLLLTGTFEAFDEEHAVAVGAAGHVSKPFEAQTLVDQVRELLANPPAAPAPAPAAAPMPPSAAAPSGQANDQSFDFFDDAGDDFALRPTASAAGPGDTLDPAGDNLDIGGEGDAFSFGDDDLGDPMEPLDDFSESIGMAPPDATVAIIPEEMSDPGATVVDASFLQDVRPQGGDPAGFAFGDDEMPAPPAAAAADQAYIDPSVSDSLAISSSDLLDPPPAAPVAMGEAPPVMEAVPAEPLPAADAGPLRVDEALDASTPLPELAGEPLGDAFDFATPLDDPMENTAGAGHPMPEMPAPPMPPEPEPVRAAPYAAEPFAEPMAEASSAPTPLPEPLADPIAEAIAEEPVHPASFGVEAAPPEPPRVAEPAPAPDLTTVLPVEPPVEPAPAPQPPVGEVPVLSEPAAAPELPVSMDPIAQPIEPMPESVPVPESAPEPVALEPLMGDSEPLMAPEVPVADAPIEPISADAVSRLVEEVTPALQQELHHTLERVAWESFGSVTEQLVAQALERIETIAWEVVPKLAETLIQEEIRKLKERS